MGGTLHQLRFEKKAEDLEARLAASGFSRTEIREENQVTVEKYGIILTEFVQTGVWERASGEKIYLYSDSVNGDLLSVFLVWNPEQEEEILKITLELLQFAAEGREVPWEKMERQLRELPEQRETILDGPCYRVGFAGRRKRKVSLWYLTRRRRTAVCTTGPENRGKFDIRRRRAYAAGKIYNGKDSGKKFPGNRVPGV